MLNVELNINVDNFGFIGDRGSLITERPFRAPHHSAFLNSEIY